MAATSPKSQIKERKPLTPFVPSTTEKPATSLASSSHIVTLPALPELYNPNFLDTILPPKPTNAKKDAPIPQNAFMDALKAEGVEMNNRMLTENASPAFKSTLDPALDFFSSAANDASEIHKLLRKSWNANPDLTLRLIFCLRSIHDGKSEKDTFYHAFGWLYRYHPRTAIVNLPMLIEPVIDRPPKKRKEGAEGEAANESEMEEDGDDWTEVGKEEEKPLPGYSHGYYKDLLAILTLAVNKELGVEGSSLSSLHNERPWWSYDDERTRKIKRREQPDSSSTSNTKTMPTASTSDSLAGYEKRPRGRPGARVPRYMLTKREIKAKRAEQGIIPHSPSPAELKAKAAKEQHERLVKLLAQDAEFRALYIGVARLFADKLGKDLSVLQRLDESQPGQAELTADERKVLRWQIGLVGKWAPTLGGSHDRQTNIATAIAQLLYSTGSMSSLRLASPLTPQSTVDASTAETLRSYYRRWIISPLRRFTHVPETFMGLDQWDKIAYDHVPSVCMRQSKKLFYKHDGERFSQYLTEVAKGKRVIQGGVLLPNEMLGEAVTLAGEIRSAQDEESRKTAMMEKQVVEGQWESMMEKMRNEAGALGNCMALCDVSGSMGDIESTIACGRRGRGGRAQFAQPIFPAVALSLIVSQLAKEPFKNSFITFSQQPQIVSIDPTAGLVETVEGMINSPWGMNTDLQAVFLKLILPLAVKNNVAKEDMIKRLFIFSDMQFDECRAGATTTWTTDHEAITQAYAAAGYDVPEIIYWNLSSYYGASKPVLGDAPGTALLSGFSANLLKLFTENDEETLREQLEAFALVEKDGETKEEKSGMNPTDVMLKAVSKKSFDGLRVLD